jgi:outer membrane protein assembly factor BamB
VVGPTRSGSRGRRAGRPSALAVLLLVLASCVGPATSTPTPNTSFTGSGAPFASTIASASSRSAVTPADWPVYHLNAQRTGDDATFPAFGGALTAGWSAPLDGAVYAEPLVVNGKVIAATEGDSVYALNPDTGAVLWRQNLGTPVPLSTLPCGDIDPLGITGTPAFDSVTGSLFAVAEVTGPHHVLFALNPSTGAVLWSRDVDLAGDDPTTHQQRPALAVANGYVYIGFGGLAGDCGQYVGEVVGVPATGSGATISYKVPTTREGAVWSTGGPVIDASGNLYVSVGNGAAVSGAYDGAYSILELSPTLQLLSRFAPSSWAADNAGDADLGSLSPVLVPGGWVFIAGKSGTGYVLHQGALGDIGGQVSSASVCAGFGGAAQNGSTIYVPCVGTLREVQVGADGSLTPGWQTNAAGESPVIGGGAVWSVNRSTGRLVALDPATGSTLGSIAVGATPHFVSPTLWNGRILVGTNAGISTAVVPIGPGATYHAVGPTRIVDTRSATGLPSALKSRIKQTITVAGGSSGVPLGAVAITANVTVTNQTEHGYVTLAPTLTSGTEPPTSTINFPLADNRANGVTVPLAAGISLDAMFWSPDVSATTALVLDVTGYFAATPG